MKKQDLIKKYQNQLKVCNSTLKHNPNGSQAKFVKVQKLTLIDILEDLEKLDNPLGEIRGLLEQVVAKINQL